MVLIIVFHSYKYFTWPVLVCIKVLKIIWTLSVSAILPTEPGSLQWGGGGGVSSVETQIEWLAKV